MAGPGETLGSPRGAQSMVPRYRRNSEACLDLGIFLSWQALIWEGRKSLVVPLWRFCSRGSIPEVLIRKFRWFRSRSSGSSDMEVLEVLVQSSVGFGPDVPVVLVQKFRFWSKSSGGYGTKVSEVLVQKFWRFWFEG
jgi:hypothetical protein